MACMQKSHNRRSSRQYGSFHRKKGTPAVFMFLIFCLPRVANALLQCGGDRFITALSYPLVRLCTSITGSLTAQVRRGSDHITKVPHMRPSLAGIYFIHQPELAPTESA
eukprot:scaffold55646_cov29-Tisochrysis_lutea.AAC.4